MKKHFYFPLAMSVILLLNGCTTAPVDGASEQTGDIAILYTGDVHCAVDKEIGYAGLKAFENSLIKDGMSTLLVDTGDALQGSALGTLSDGMAIVEIKNAMGYDAMSIGNHEFDFGMPEFMAAREAAEFPFLSINFVDNTTGEQVLDSYVIKEEAGIKIAFVGITTPLSQIKSSPKNFMDEAGNIQYNFLQDGTGDALWAEMQEQVDSARAEGADIVVVLSHLGTDDEGAPYTSYSLIKNTTGIDVVLDGHTHAKIESARVRNEENDFVLLSSTGTKLENIGFLLIEEDGNMTTGLISDYDEKDKAIETLITKINTEFEGELNKVVASTKLDFVASDAVTEERIIRGQETNLGNLVSDAFRSAAESDVAIINGGGVRSSIKAGDVTYADILAVVPFSNGLCKVSATGQEILDALEHGARDINGDSGAFLQVSGITFTINSGIESSVELDEDGMFMGVKGEYRVSDVLINGEPLVLDKDYTVTSVSFLLKYGGDGFSMFMDNEIIQDEFIGDYEAIIKYFNKEYKENPETYSDPLGEGRITIK